jgi:hypothetical protein
MDHDGFNNGFIRSTCLVKFYAILSHLFSKWDASGGSIAAQGSFWVDVFKRPTEEQLVSCEYYFFPAFHCSKAYIITSLETGLLYACLLFVPTVLQYLQIRNLHSFLLLPLREGFREGSLAFGLINPTTIWLPAFGCSLSYPYVSNIFSAQYISGVMYQLCGIFGVRIKFP